MLLFAAAALVVMTPSGWSDPAQTAQVQAKDKGYVSVSSLLPTDRVFACSVAPVGKTCPGNAPGRTDDWWTAAEAFAAAPSPVTFGTVTFAWGTPSQNSDGSALMDLAGYKLFLRLQDCDPSLPGCAVVAYGTAIDLGLVNTFTVSAVAREACARIQARSVPGEVGVMSDEVCGGKKLPKTIPGSVPGLRVE